MLYAAPHLSPSASSASASTSSSAASRPRPRRPSWERAFPPFDEEDLPSSDDDELQFHGPNAPPRLSASCSSSSSPSQSSPSPLASALASKRRSRTKPVYPPDAFPDPPLSVSYDDASPLRRSLDETVHLRHLGGGGIFSTVDDDDEADIDEDEDEDDAVQRWAKRRSAEYPAKYDLQTQYTRYRADMQLQRRTHPRTSPFDSLPPPLSAPLPVPHPERRWAASATYRPLNMTHRARTVSPAGNKQRAAAARHVGAGATRSGTMMEKMRGRERAGWVAYVEDEDGNEKAFGARGVFDDDFAIGRGRDDDEGRDGDVEEEMLVDVDVDVQMDAMDEDRTTAPSANNHDRAADGEKTRSRRRRLSKLLMRRRKADESDNNGTGDENDIEEDNEEEDDDDERGIRAAYRRRSGEFTCVPFRSLSLQACPEPCFVLYSPTCTQILRIRWQSIALSWRFRIFRVKRRILRKVGGKPRT